MGARYGAAARGAPHKGAYLFDRAPALCWARHGMARGRSCCCRLASTATGVGNALHMHIRGSRSASSKVGTFQVRLVREKPSVARGATNHGRVREDAPAAEQSLRQGPLHTPLPETVVVVLSLACVPAWSRSLRRYGGGRARARQCARRHVGSGSLDTPGEDITQSIRDWRVCLERDGQRSMPCFATGTLFSNSYGASLWPS